MKPSALNRLILFVSLVGMVLALHLWVQKARDFDQGCFGVSKPIFVPTGGCRDVNDLPASHLFGVSNAAWGYAFYFGLALVSFAKIVTPPELSRRLHRIGEASVAGAALYSGYLVYAMAAARAFCALCLTSALLVAGLVVLHAAVRRRGGFVPVAEADRGIELGIAVGGFFGAAGLIVAVLLFVNRLGTRPLSWGGSAGEIEEMVGHSLPVFIDAKRLAEIRSCRFESRTPTLEFEKAVGRTLPALGKRGGLALVAFYDPNCGGCQVEFAELMRLAEKHRDTASFTLVARPLWDKSMLQVQALRIAESSDKYFEVWRRMMARRGQDEMDLGQIRALFAAVGLPTDDLERRLEAVRRDVLADRHRAKVAGINRLPALFIAGRKVAENNSSETCVEQLIAKAAADAAGGNPR